jgi:hypothetical protein
LAFLPSEWVNFGEAFPERLAGEEVGGVFDRGKSDQAFLRLHAGHPSPSPPFTKEGSENRQKSPTRFGEEPTIF